MRFEKCLLIILCFLQFSCNDRSKSNLNNSIEFDSILENDTLLLTKTPENLKSWITFYSKTDKQFTLSNFKASGVILHMPELKKTDSSLKINLSLQPLFEYAPNRLKYIDLWSYGQDSIPEKAWKSRSELAKYIGLGEADQQVVLALEDGQRYELMFNGPANFSEIADWINNDQLLISLVTKEREVFTFEIFIFDISQNLFTNYRLNHTYPDTVEKQSYIEFRLNETDKLIK